MPCTEFYGFLRIAGINAYAMYCVMFIPCTEFYGIPSHSTHLAETDEFKKLDQRSKASTHNFASSEEREKIKIQNTKNVYE
jgi:hypothetical protein